MNDAKHVQSAMFQSTFYGVVQHTSKHDIYQRKTPDLMSKFQTKSENTGDQ